MTTMTHDGYLATLEIDDAAAVPALTKLVTNERHRSVKILLLEELLHIGSPAAMPSSANGTTRARNSASER